MAPVMADAHRTVGLDRYTEVKSVAYPATRVGVGYV